MAEPMIGILAGMGPRSTAPFVDLVVRECQEQYGARYDEEFPHMLIYSLPTPFYIDRPIDHSLMKKTIMAGVRKLESCGADFIAMPCNSAHAYYDELAGSIGIPLLNMADETVKLIPGSFQKTTLLSTSITFGTGLYQKAILDRGCEFIFKEEWQQAINSTISAIKRGDEKTFGLGLWDGLLESIRSEGIKNVIAACTDLNVLLKDEPDIKFIDSSACLAKAAVSKYLELKKG